ncbi:isocitrate lyase/PEP mutase family protein [Siccirubricoccus sp. KC 17139]|uniref:Isocitrate lyase/PEP mutase family protein n=1 Tax=Siccirubricoccus soli TaxID=2899147 RepID=A0ABT1DBH9_9PROT|nr:isocitrate lyase/PEP mutase family protein [Siccirubricoccus soli]MCO6418937.1 isocitrate lyase/PEP mutase family protein [Siccirubricoccus soli]MCP2685072.1 isocitrate lyase/PEP mutase family protein [Siccirubricoccus soli]
MSSVTDRRLRFRQVLAGNVCVHPGSVYDPMSARIAEELGFEVGMYAGSTASLTVLGAPDLILLTLSEFADQARRICRAAKTLPVLVDADHGYGNALNAMRAVEELETAGIAAMTLEDTVLPRPFGDGKVTLISLEEGLGKVRASLAARDDPSFCIVARSGVVAVNGIEDAVARTKAYTESGADALFYTGIRTRAELDAVSAVATLPIILGGVDTPELNDRSYLAARGVRIALQGHQPIQAAQRAVYETLKALREGVAPRDLTLVPKDDLMARVTRDADYKRWTRDYLEGSK